MTTPTLRFKQVFQLGIIVKNIDASVGKYKSMLGVTDAAITRFRTSDLPDWTKLKYKGAPVDFQLDIALINHAGIQFELIQPLSGDANAYSDFLEQVGEGIQHIMVQVDYGATLKSLEEAAYPPLTEGQMVGTQFRYFDLTNDLGFVLELVDVPDDFVQSIIGAK
jgi:hypothetical protein